jgi:hypothetical protein
LAPIALNLLCNLVPDHMARQIFLENEVHKYLVDYLKGNLDKLGSNLDSSLMEAILSSLEIIFNMVQLEEDTAGHYISLLPLFAKLEHSLGSKHA